MRRRVHSTKKRRRVRMSISSVRFIIAAILIMTGILIMVIQTFSVYRQKYALNRIHAAAMGDSLGIMMVILGMMVIYGFSFASLKLLTVLIVFWFASPVCSHLLAKLEVSTSAGSLWFIFFFISRMFFRLILYSLLTVPGAG